LLKTILVPVDFSETSNRALDQAVGLARRLGATIILLLVVEPADFVLPGELYGPAVDLAPLLQAQRRSGRTRLQGLKAKVDDAGVTCVLSLRTGAPEQVIVQEAKKRKADLIVMGTHGRTGISHLVMGSVAERVVRTSGCPVLTVHGTVSKPGTRRPSRRRKGVR
jgi:nucleotide-binding universal stress UspA family protein